MKRTFPGYYRPSDEEFVTLWASAIFVLDANVLLNIYGYSENTREVIIRLIGAVNARLWIPYQFASEYQKNRIRKILEQEKIYRDAHRNLEEMLKKFKAQHTHPHIGKNSLRSFESLCGELKKGEKKHSSLLKQDSYFKRLSELLDGKVGPVPNDDDLLKLYEEARKRYTSKTPPGYLDSNKPEPDGFGDFIGWRQILNYGVAQKKPLIFVTDDRKADWWSIFEDRTIGPRNELVAEYQKLCNAQFYMYTLEQFLRYAQKHLGQTIASSTLKEVSDRTGAHNLPDSGNKPKATKEAGEETKSLEMDLPKTEIAKAQPPEGK